MFYVFDDFSRDAADNNVLGYVFGHHRPGGDNGVVVNRDARKNRSKHCFQYGSGREYYPLVVSDFGHD